MKVHDALELARVAHEGQRRDSDGEPYVRHPVEVADIVRGAGYGDEVQAAAVLHDVLERSDVGREEIERRFGSRVATLVEAMTEDYRLSEYETRKAAHREQVAAAGPEAAAIFLADKVAKVRELRAALRSGQLSIDSSGAHLEERVRHYERTRDLLGETYSAQPLWSQLDRELAELRTTMAGAAR